MPDQPMPTRQPEVHLSARLPAPLAEDVRRLAAATDRSVSAVTRIALAEHLQRHEGTTA